MNTPPELPWFDPQALAAHVLRPARPALLDAVACALEWSPDETARRRASGAPLPLELLGRRGMLDPHEAWEAMVARALVPAAWAVEWRFLGKRPGEMNFPATVREAVALASDAAGMGRAVALAREIAARLEPWDGARAGRVVWSVDAAPRIDALLWPAPLVRLVDAHGAHDPRVRDAARAYAAARMARADALDASDLLHDVRHVVVGAATFEGLAHDPAARVPDRVDATDMPAGVRGAPFATLPSPYAPMLALLETGYVLRAIARGALVLVAPDV